MHWTRLSKTRVQFHDGFASKAKSSLTSVLSRRAVEEAGPLYFFPYSRIVELITSSAYSTSSPVMSAWVAMRQ